MNYLEKLEEDLYIAIVRSSSIPDGVHMTKNRALRNGTEPEDIETALKEAQKRTQNLGFVAKVPTDSQITEVSVPTPSADQSQDNGLQLLGKISHAGHIEMHKGKFMQENVWVRKLDVKSKDLVAKWLKAEQKRAESLRGSPRFLKAKSSHSGHLLIAPQVGQTLAAEMLSGGKMKPKKAIAIGDQILEAMQHLHAQDLVHRYPDPARILVNQEQVTMLDWGLPADSKAQPHYGPPSHKQYLPPEHPRTAGVLSDIYAFGILLTEMLTGKRDKVSQGQIPGSRLRKVARKCTEAQPGDRYRSAAEVRKALQKKRRWPWLILLLLLLAGGAAAGWYFFWPQTTTMYVLGNNVHPRNPNDLEETLPKRYDFGDELKISRTENEYAYFDLEGKEVPIKVRYLTDEKTIREIEAIYGNQAAKEQLKASYERIALLNYFHDNDLIGDLNDDDYKRFYTDGKQREKWQFYGRFPENKLQPYLTRDMKFKNGVIRWAMATIIQKKDQPNERRFLLFSFDKNNGNAPTLEFQKDISAFPGYYLRTESKASKLRDFPNQFLAGIDVKSAAIVLENEDSRVRYMVVRHQGGYEWVAPKSSGRSSPSVSNDYQAYKNQLADLKPKVKLYYRTQNSVLKLDLINELETMLQQYGTTMDYADREYMNRELKRLK